ncbi:MULTISPECIES: hypothetical protein [Rhizobium]|jgi:hypothetical protein|uniref:Uncharacterized protein n=1 Tax=Rhizobium leguminosarum bv. trifolii (strain WSM1325) TaxID=395491 RepID=C6AWT4_RHILS|nr:hypothetical protein [Rhizobium leguminosarum]ACS57981.1 conserved hypothetical protein [Rhizobium leguminosarum bv. trifolii WSM1325]MBY2906876.1 hypothetical protein [Rhizobium leguminosarum]MBY2915028.1 hypothetical protein [Rhizobium leguminosarum]MBY2920946.1 hypothetical protein [Rhizobium leguminosarum]MBY2933879.1 hypothetical protein [Rhizobium leguminosarum]
MLPLDNKRWGELSHCYGPAADTPALLRALDLPAGPDLSPDAEPWFSLWSSLCHQGDVYTASYAAVPHIVRIGLATTAPIDFSFYQLPASIEIARMTGRGPEIPADLEEAYHHAITSMTDCVSLHRHETWSRSTLLSAGAAQAVAKGHIDIAEALLNLDDDIIARINNFDFD